MASLDMSRVRRAFPVLNKTTLPLLIIGLLTAGLAQAIPVGYVEKISGPGDFQLIRTDAAGHERIGNLARSEPLRPGDRILCRKDDAELVLRLASGKRKVIGKGQCKSMEDADCVVIGKASSLPGNILRWVTELLRRYLHQDIKVVQGGIRGPAGSLKIPLLQQAKSRLASGEGALHLIWSGGLPPYRVRIGTKDSDATVFDKAEITDQEVEIPGRKLQPDREYRLELWDKNARFENAEFSTVSTKQVPQLSAECQTELKASSLPKAIRETLAAAWLIRQDDGAWILQAYQTLATNADKDALADLLARGIRDNSIWDLLEQTKGLYELKCNGT